MGKWQARWRRIKKDKIKGNQGETDNLGAREKKSQEKRSYSYKRRSKFYQNISKGKGKKYRITGLSLENRGEETAARGCLKT